MLVWGLNPGPPALNASTIPLGYRGGGYFIMSFTINSYLYLTRNKNTKLVHTLGQSSLSEGSCMSFMVSAYRSEHWNAIFTTMASFIPAIQNQPWTNNGNGEIIICGIQFYTRWTFFLNFNTANDWLVVCVHWNLKFDWTEIIFLPEHPQIINCNCQTFHRYQFFH